MDEVVVYDFSGANHLEKAALRYHISEKGYSFSGDFLVDSEGNRLGVSVSEGDPLTWRGIIVWNSCLEEVVDSFEGL